MSLSTLPSPLRILGCEVQACLFAVSSTEGPDLLFPSRALIHSTSFVWPSSSKHGIVLTANELADVEPQVLVVRGAWWL